MKNIIALVISVAIGLFVFWFIRGILAGIRHLKWAAWWLGYRLVANAIPILIGIVAVVVLYQVLKKIL